MGPETTTLDNSTLMVLVGGVGAAFTAAAFIASVVLWWLQNRSKTISRAYELFRYYYGYEHHRWIHGPTQQVITKWFNLPKSEREEFRREAVSFWAGFTENRDFIEKFVHDTDPPGTHCERHFKRIISRDGLTECQALDCNLHFWSGLYELIEAGIVHKATVHKLFVVPYKWRIDFYRDFRTSVKKAIRELDPEPDWIGNMEKLEAFLIGETTSDSINDDEKN